MQCRLCLAVLRPAAPGVRRRGGFALPPGPAAPGPDAPLPRTVAVFGPLRAPRKFHPRGTKTGNFPKNGHIAYAKPPKDMPLGRRRRPPRRISYGLEEPLLHPEEVAKK
jgi:hypothetical protein